MDDRCTSGDELVQAQVRTLAGWLSEAAHTANEAGCAETDPRLRFQIGDLALGAQLAAGDSLALLGAETPVDDESAAVGGEDALTSGSWRDRLVSLLSDAEEVVTALPVGLTGREPLLEAVAELRREGQTCGG